MRQGRFDPIDRAILAALLSDGRITNAALAERVGLSQSACLRRLRLLEESGVIDGYGARVNEAALGKGNSVFVQISLERQQEEDLRRFEEKVRACPDILECYLMSGDQDYLLRVAITDGADYERVHNQVLTALPGVARVRSSFAIRTVAKRYAPRSSSAPCTPRGAQSAPACEHGPFNLQVALRRRVVNPNGVSLSVVAGG